MDWTSELQATPMKSFPLEDLLWSRCLFTAIETLRQTLVPGTGMLLWWAWSCFCLEECGLWYFGLRKQPDALSTARWTIPVGVWKTMVLIMTWTVWGLTQDVSKENFYYYYYFTHTNPSSPSLPSSRSSHFPHNLPHSLLLSDGKPRTLG